MINKKVVDERHANLMNKWLSMMERNTPRSTKIETEYYFNWYGERGYIDIITFDSIERTDTLVWVVEIKPIIDDVGNLIRQIKKYTQTLPKIIKGDVDINTQIVVEYNELNIKIIKDYLKILQRGLSPSNIFLVENTTPMNFYHVRLLEDKIEGDDVVIKQLIL